MLGDLHTRFSGASVSGGVASATAGQAVTAAGATVSENSIDQLAMRDFGAGREVFAIVNIVAAPVAVRTNVSATVVVATDICTLASHGLPTGTPIILLTATTISTGFTLGTVYYVISLTANTFSLATTKAIALTGVADVNFGAADGSFTFTAIPEVEFQVIAAGDNLLTTDIQVLGSSGPLQARVAHNVTFTEATNVCNHSGMQVYEGAPVVFGGAGTQPTGITAGVTYYMVNTTNTTFQMAASRADVAAGVAIDITTAGSGVLTATIADQQLAGGGPQIAVRFNPQDSLQGRFLGMRYINTCPMSAGTYISQPGPLLPQSPKLYPLGYVV
jgi:hypothetical protein